MQVLFFGQLLKVSLQSLQGRAGKHPGVSKVIQAIRQKYHFHSTHKRSQNKRINNTRIMPELIQIPEWIVGPVNLMHIDRLPDLPPSGR